MTLPTGPLVRQPSSNHPRQHPQHLWLESLEPRQFLTAGALDTAFGQGGTAVAGFSGPNNVLAMSLATTPQGKLMVGGDVSNRAGWTSVIARFDRNGVLDSSFDQDGYRLGNSSEPFAGFHQVIPLGDGSCLAMGYGGLTNVLAKFRADGTLDRSFAQNGWFSMDTPFWPPRVAVQPDGRIVIGYHNNAAWLLRLNPDGTRDLTFGSAGEVRMSFPGWAELARILVRPNGRILVGGIYHTGDNSSKLVLRQFTPDGSPDLRFGSQGQVAGDFFIEDVCNDMALDAQGRILVTSSTSNQPAIARFTPLGVLDKTFGHRGILTITSGEHELTHRSAGHIVFQRDGKMITLIDTAPLAHLVRLNSDGSLDNNFGTRGFAQINVGQGIGGYFVQERSGMIWVVGNMSTGVSLERLLPDGTHDASFGQQGQVAAVIRSPGDDRVTAATWQPDGKILLGGNTEDGSGIYPRMTRFTPQGTLDPFFGDNGSAVLSLPPEGSRIESIAVLPSGKILVGGGGWRPEEGFVARLNSDGSLDTSFGTGGVLLQYGHFAAIALGANGRFYGFGSNSFLTRFNADGSVDPTFSGEIEQVTWLFPEFSHLRSANALTAQPDGRLLVIGGSHSHVAVARLTLDGHPDPSFGEGGLASIDAGGTYNVPGAIALQADGKLVLAVRRHDLAVVSFLLVRLNADGSVDSTFGNAGIATLPVSASEYGNVSDPQVTITPDGRIVVAASEMVDLTSSRSRTVICRFNSDGSADNSFGEFGRLNLDYATTTLPRALLPDTPNAVFLAATARSSFTGDDLLLARYALDDPNPITARLDSGVLRITGSSTADKIRFRTAASMVQVRGVAQSFAADAFSRIQIDAKAGNDRVDASGIDLPVWIEGGEGNDVLLGGPSGDYLSGGPGHDALTGAGGHDTLFGGQGDDTLAGGEGNDYLNGGPGRDLVNGNAGNDQFLANDGEADTLDGGPGFDRVKGDVLDRIIGMEGLLA